MHNGEEVAGEILHWGDLIVDSDQDIEMFDLTSLFAEAESYSLSEGVYRAHTLVVDRKVSGFSRNTYFSMISRHDITPERWVKFAYYMADGSNMALAVSVIGKTFKVFQQGLTESKEDIRRWNLLVDLAYGYDADAAGVLSKAGIQLASSEVAGSLVVMPTSKIANLFVGFKGDSPVAIQGRWL